MNKSLLLLGLFALLWTACEQAPTSSERLDATKLTFRGNHDAYIEAPSNAQASNTTNQVINAQAGTLTAGEWNDLDHWGFWQQLQQNADFYHYLTYWDCYLNNRYQVQWLDANQQPVINATVTLSDGTTTYWSAQTNHNGEAVLWYQPYEATAATAKKLAIQGTYQGTQYTIQQAQTYREGINAFQLPHVIAPVQPLTEVFVVVDATGSMGDELSYLNLELQSVIQEYQYDAPQAQLRLGALLYRDHEDDYLMRKSDLTTNTSSVFEFLLQQNADGGGDFPEAVEVALEEAIEHQAWSANATAKIIFLLLDAPPRQDKATVERFKNTLSMAAKKGIQIIPIASSGVDKETEFLMRFTAQLTNGTYTFITDHSGVGHRHIEPTIGNYPVELLNNLLLRLMLERTPNRTSIIQ